MFLNLVYILLGFVCVMSVCFIFVMKFGCVSYMRAFLLFKLCMLVCVCRFNEHLCFKIVFFTLVNALMKQIFSVFLLSLLKDQIEHLNQKD